MHQKSLHSNKYYDIILAYHYEEYYGDMVEYYEQYAILYEKLYRKQCRKLDSRSDIYSKTMCSMKNNMSGSKLRSILKSAYESKVK